MRNIIAILKFSKRSSTSLLFWLSLVSLVSGVRPVLYVIMPKFILDELLGLQRPQYLFGYVAFLCLGALFTALLGNLAEGRFTLLAEELNQSLRILLANKTLNIEYHLSESKSVLDIKERARNSLDYLYQLSPSLVSTGGALVTITSTATLMISWRWWLVILVLGISLLTIPLLKKLQVLELDNSARSASEIRAFRYFLELAVDYRYAKDLRLFDGVDLIMSRAKKSMDSILRINHDYFTRSGTLNGLIRVLVEIQTGLVFIILGINLLFRQLSVGNFTMLYGASRQLGSAVSLLFDQIRVITTINLELAFFVDFMRLPDRDGTERTPVVNQQNDEVENVLSEINEGKLSVQVQDVSFRYPTRDELVLDHLSFAIQPGETVALVGRNGAGKSTLVKLLCRLYKPECGRILINGIDIWDFPLEQYYGILSVIFQDFQLLPLLLSENIGCKKSDQISDDELARIEEALGKSDMLKWAQALPYGIHTPMTRLLSDDGAVPSGGQEQKIAIARAVYHDGRLVIMDEPTSALDPRNEEQVFSQMLSITQNHTAIFISHRLSSTRHADRIFVLDGGKLLAEGSHEALMEHEGLYRSMYLAQADQYASEL